MKVDSGGRKMPQIFSNIHKIFLLALFMCMLESSQGITPLFGSPYLYTSFNYPSPPNQPARDRYSYARKFGHFGENLISLLGNGYIGGDPQQQEQQQPYPQQQEQQQQPYPQGQIMNHGVATNGSINTFRKKRNPSAVYQSSGPSSYRTYNTYSSSSYNNASPSYSYSSQISTNSFRPKYS